LLHLSRDLDLIFQAALFFHLSVEDRILENDRGLSNESFEELEVALVELAVRRLRVDVDQTERLVLLAQGRRHDARELHLRDRKRHLLGRADRVRDADRSALVEGAVDDRLRKEELRLVELIALSLGALLLVPSAPDLEDRLPALEKH